MVTAWPPAEVSPAVPVAAVVAVSQLPLPLPRAPPTGAVLPAAVASRGRRSQTADPPPPPQKFVAWTAEEDEMLVKLVGAHKNSWVRIAEELATATGGSPAYREARLCRDRWVYKLDPVANTVAAKWTEAELAVL
eukprot:SAG22_NODE_11650_length_475_cov_1.375000_1_plen_134_part_01